MSYTHRGLCEFHQWIRSTIPGLTLASPFRHREIVENRGRKFHCPGVPKKESELECAFGTRFSSQYQPCAMHKAPAESLDHVLCQLERSETLNESIQ